jgi:hypothetical protein
MPYADHRIADFERCLLSAYMLGADIGERITKDVFVFGAHKVIFQAINATLMLYGINPTI